MIPGGIPTPRPLLNLIATDPTAVVVLTAAETVVEVDGVHEQGVVDGGRSHG